VRGGRLSVRTRLFPSEQPPGNALLQSNARDEQDERDQVRYAYERGRNPAPCRQDQWRWPGRSKGGFERVHRPGAQLRCLNGTVFSAGTGFPVAATCRDTCEPTAQAQPPADSALPALGDAAFAQHDTF